MACSPTRPRTPVPDLYHQALKTLWFLIFSCYPRLAAPRFVSCYRWRSSLALQTVRAPLWPAFYTVQSWKTLAFMPAFLAFPPAPEARKLSYGPSILFSDGLASRWSALLRNPSLGEHRKAPNNCVCVCVCVCVQWKNKPQIAFWVSEVCILPGKSFLLWGCYCHGQLRTRKLLAETFACALECNWKQLFCFYWNV